jgi:hypothetical protein
MAGLNLHKIVTPILNNITPEFNVILKLFNGNIKALLHLHILL